MDRTTERAPGPATRPVRADGGEPDPDEEPTDERPGDERPAAEEPTIGAPPAEYACSTLHVRLEQLTVHERTDEPSPPDEVRLRHYASHDRYTHTPDRYEGEHTYPGGRSAVPVAAGETLLTHFVDLGAFHPVGGLAGADDCHVGFTAAVVFEEHDPLCGLLDLFDVARDAAVEAARAHGVALPFSQTLVDRVARVAADVADDLFDLLFGWTGLGHDRMGTVAIAAAGPLRSDVSVAAYLAPFVHETWTVTPEGDDAVTVTVPLERHGGRWEARLELRRTVHDTRRIRRVG
jgi:hypothetical protein